MSHWQQIFFRGSPKTPHRLERTTSTSWQFFHISLIYFPISTSTVTCYAFSSDIQHILLHLSWMKVKVKSLSLVWLFATPWTVACQAPLSMGFSRQEYRSGLPVPYPGLNTSPLILLRKWKQYKKTGLVSHHQIHHLTPVHNLVLPICCLFWVWGYSFWQSCKSLIFPLTVLEFESNTFVLQWLYFLLINVNWSIVALQCCVSLYSTAKWISHTYTYIPSLLESATVFFYVQIFDHLFHVSSLFIFIP